MVLYWNEILPAAIESLPPLHREIITYIMNLPGKQRRSYKHALEEWNLSRDEFDAEVEYAYSALRRHLRRHGLVNSGDLEML